MSAWAAGTANVCGRVVAIATFTEESSKELGLSLWLFYFLLNILKPFFLRFNIVKIIAMKWYNNFRNVKFVLIAVAALIALASLYVSNTLVNEL